MNFKQFYNEAILDDLSKIQSIRHMTEDELINIGIEHEDQSFTDSLDFNKGWCLVSRVYGEEEFVIPWLPSSHHRTFGLRFYKSFPEAKYYNVGGDVYKGSKTVKAIEDFELKRQLSPNTLETFGELMDEL